MCGTLCVFMCIYVYWTHGMLCVFMCTGPMERYVYSCVLCVLSSALILGQGNINGDDQHLIIAFYALHK